MKWLTSLGLVLFTLHGDWATWKNSDGDVLFFTPMLGVLVLLGVDLYLWKKKRLTLGPKKVWIPLTLVTLFICLRIFFEPNSMSLLECAFATVLLLCYLIGRTLGLGIFSLFVPLTALQSLSVIFYTILETNWDNYNSLTNGGYLNKYNYEATSAVIVFGTVVGLLLIKDIRWRAIYLLTGFLGTILTGSPQGALVLGALVLFVLVRKDVSRYSFAVGLALLVLLSLWCTVGPGLKQFQRTSDVLQTVTTGAVLDEKDEDYKWGKNRIPAYEDTLKGISFFGHGYSVYSENETGRRTPENVPLVILEQIGILAVLSWLFITGWCFFKGRLKYIWLTLIVVGLFDHTTWTMLVPHWFTIVGVTTAYTGKDWIFKSELT